MIRRVHAGWIVGLAGLGLLAGCMSAPRSGSSADPNVAHQVNFRKPEGMQIGWKNFIQTETMQEGKRVIQTTVEDGWQTPQVTVPGHANFKVGTVTILKLTNVSGRSDKAYYCSLEMRPRTPASEHYAAHTAIPVIFSDEDFDQVDGNNFVTKVVYLPTGPHQELALGGDVELLVATRLDPGDDPIAEAAKKGDVLLVVRMGNRVPD